MRRSAISPGTPVKVHHYWITRSIGQANGQIDQKAHLYFYLLIFLIFSLLYKDKVI